LRMRSLVGSATVRSRSAAEVDACICGGTYMPGGE
jgi:hypothetical protein